jgi:hypothetical protein
MRSLPREPVDLWPALDLHAHECFYCSGCRTIVAIGGWPARCMLCNSLAEKRYVVDWPPPPPAFGLRVKIEREGRVIQDVKLGPSTSADGTTATVFQEWDRRDADKSQQRYRKKVIRSTGLITKDADALVTNQEAHGRVGFIRDPESPPPPGDPLHVKLAHNTKSRRQRVDFLLPPWPTIGPRT